MLQLYERNKLKLKLKCGHVACVACSHGADVVFALDASGSIGFDNFQLMTQFVGMVIQSLDIDSSADGPTISRVGLVTFSDSTVLQFNLDRYTTKAELLQAVNVPYLTGSTNTEQAIRFATIIRRDRGCYGIASDCIKPSCCSKLFVHCHRCNFVSEFLHLQRSILAFIVEHSNDPSTH